ncbi:hypothetical protein XENTR_v10004780 [Xenopus tropicalis]|uniref:Uncharacterized protein tff3.4 n=1 Tax=Xenopus tropicalis TaxID=8364 RepID=A0A8J0QWZ0_XENTR|nr:uncharacterized protein tff3.4 [Xenopus tropicalis]KAE8621346.1 hypothetical protein XENTR_v10004780 [Xenopus tropicalis]|eukprot:XP_002940506.1 PREDICTED: uncharacterized protein LOC100488906 [Xenopus tropicalis]
MLYITAIVWAAAVFSVEKTAGYSTIYRCTSQNPSGRQECGHSGITQDQCTANGCCFDTSAYGSFSCFKPYAVSQIGGSVAVQPIPVQPIPVQNIAVRPVPVQPISVVQVQPKEKSACDICKAEQMGQGEPGIFGKAFNFIFGKGESTACAQCRAGQGIPKKETSLFGGLFKKRVIQK